MIELASIIYTGEESRRLRDLNELNSAMGGVAPPQMGGATPPIAPTDRLPLVLEPTAAVAVNVQT